MKADRARDKGGINSTLSRYARRVRAAARFGVRPAYLVLHYQNSRAVSHVELTIGSIRLPAAITFNQPNVARDILISQANQLRVRFTQHTRAFYEKKYQLLIISEKTYKFVN